MQNGSAAPELNPSANTRTTCSSTILNALSKWPWRMAFKCTSVGLMVLVIIAGFVKMTKLSGVSAFSDFFLILFIWLFAVIFMTSEMQALSKCDSVDETLRRNFGILYRNNGRGIYMILLAFLVMALGMSDGWGIAAGILLLLEAIALLYISNTYPGWMAKPSAQAASGPGGPPPPPAPVRPPPPTTGPAASSSYTSATLKSATTSLSPGRGGVDL